MMKRVHFKQGMKYGPEASTSCTVFYPINGGWLSEVFTYNHNQQSPEWVDAQINLMRVRLRTAAMQIEDFETRYNKTSARNIAQTIKCA